MSTANLTDSSESSTKTVSEAIGLHSDPRWQLIEIIASSDEFHRSSRLPALLRYLGKCTIEGNWAGLTEYAIARGAFDKDQDFDPAEDSCVRVYVRQLRTRLHEYFHAPDHAASFVIDLPKGGYALSFVPTTSGSLIGSAPEITIPRTIRGRALRWAVYLSVASLVAATICAVGWFRATRTQGNTIPWPLNQVVVPQTRTLVVLSDVGFQVRMLGAKGVPLAQYVNRGFLSISTPEHPSNDELRILRNLDVTQITSMADARAAASLSVLASPFSQNLLLRSARDLSPNDVAHGNLIFIGSQIANPWVALYEDRLNFQFAVDSSTSGRYIQNRNPLAGERAIYSVQGDTESSDEDYATITLMQNKDGDGEVLLLRGLRMEGTQATINVLQNPAHRAELRNLLAKIDGSSNLSDFEALLHVRCVAGAPVSVEILSVRRIPS